MTDATPAAPTAEATPHLPTLMTVHAHPDDETIGTGGTMAKAVAEGRRVVLVTCTRGGEMGEIVVPDLDTRTTIDGWARSAPASSSRRWATSGSPSGRTSATTTRT